MPANPRQCRLNAARCLVRAKRVRNHDTRQVFSEMAELWNRLADVMECAPLFQSISEMEPGELHNSLPKAVRLRYGEYA